MQNHWIRNIARLSTDTDILEPLMRSILFSFISALTVLWHNGFAPSIMSKWTWIWRERPGLRDFLSLLGNLDYPLVKLEEGGTTLGVDCVTHMGHSLHVLPNGLQVFEWTAVLEGGTIFSDTFELHNELFIRAFTFTEHWALVRDLFHGQRVGILQFEKKKNILNWVKEVVIY